MDFTGKSKAEYVKNTFNTIAKRYDLMNSIMSLGMDNSWRKRAVRIVRAKQGMEMLDVCCGTGKLLMEVSKAVSPSGKVTGLDFSEQMLAEAKKNLDNKKDIELIQGDAMSLPFKDNSFDGATVGWGLRNVPDLRRGVEEMTRVVRPGCMVVSLDMAKPEMPIFKQVYWLYFKWLVPVFGKLWAGKKNEYNYLYK
ncbi:MAG: bifunctional demethylmenaquinone methyltransferase/2-methoxy-6-polyprenyl-1,4-benzoquinol methylase UbiE, partial [Eubacteriales bacterium]